MNDHECKKVSVVVFGSRPDQTDGILWITMKNNEILVGTKEQPGGLLKKIEDQERTLEGLRRWFWISVGAGLVLNFLLFKLLPPGALLKLFKLL